MYLNPLLSASPPVPVAKPPNASYSYAAVTANDVLSAFFSIMFVVSPWALYEKYLLLLALSFVFTISPPAPRIYDFVPLVTYSAITFPLFHICPVLTPFTVFPILVPVPSYAYIKCTLGQVITCPRLIY